MAIKNLELRAKVVVEGFWNGLHRSPYHGFSVEFTEYRQYVPGDDPRYLDWRLFGRSDRYYIKKFEDETNLRCHLLLDRSRSMEFGTLSHTKAQYAATLAATFATEQKTSQKNCRCSFEVQPFTTESQGICTAKSSWGMTSATLKSNAFKSCEG